MTRAEVIVALRRGDASPEVQSRAADLLMRRQPQKRGRPPKSSDAKLSEARALIAQVEAKAVELGDKGQAYAAFTTPKRNAASVKRAYMAAKQLDFVDFIDTVVFSNEDDEKLTE